MSGSEGKQNSQMSVREREEYAMSQELMGMGMYENGMTYELMKQVLGVINESKDMAGIETENRASQEVNKEYPEEMGAAEIPTKNNSGRELILEENSLPKPSYSYRQQSGRSSPPASERKPNLEADADEEMSLGSPDMFGNDEPKRSSTEGESLFDKLVKENEKTVEKNELPKENRTLTRSMNSWRIFTDNSQSSQGSQSLETTNNNDNKSKKNERIERWKLDPTNSVVDDNDLPLKDQLRPVLEESVPYSFCHDRKVFEPNIRDKVLTVLTHTLGEVADIWRSQHRPDVTEFQWGSPIKVGAPSRMSDTKLVIEDADSPERGEFIRSNPDSVQRRNMDRNCKRKAVEIIRDLVDEDLESEGSSDNIFESKKQKKSSDTTWQPLKSNSNKSEKILTRQEKIFNNLSNSNKSAQSAFIDDYEIDDLDNDDLHNLRKKYTRTKNEDIASASLSAEYPRRVPPPNPMKPKAGGRPRRNGEKTATKNPVKKNSQGEKNENSETWISTRKNRNPLSKQRTNAQTSKLNDNDISKELERDQPEEIDLEIEIKPKPIKGLASKLNQGASFLLENKKTEERLALAKIQEQVDAENEERLRKKEIAEQRFLKEKVEQEERENRERKVEAKEENWKTALAARQREHRRRQMEEKTRSAQAEKGVLLMDGDEDVDSLIDNINAKQRSMEKLAQCPICHLEFSVGEIAEHAADCIQYDMSDEPGTSVDNDNSDLIITNRRSLLHCHICSHFNTADGVVYEEHVHQCMKRQLDEKQFDSRSKNVIEVPNSPIRCFVPISQQTESEIDYSDQFTAQSTNNKTNTKSRIKRRR